MADRDELVLCPYDPAHEILKSRLQWHLVRCAKNHTMKDKEICPYNSTHVVDKINFQDHLATCLSYREVQSFRFKTDDKELVGIVPMSQVAQAHSRPVVGEENWDDDVYHQTYDPIKNSEDKPLVRSLIGASKAKRREFRMRERQRMAQLDDEKPTPEAPPVVVHTKKSTEPLRAPKNTNIEEEKKPTPKPLRPPKNMPTTSSEETPDSGASSSLINPVPEEEPKREASGWKKDSKISEKPQIPKRKPHLNFPTSDQPPISLDSDLAKLSISTDSAAEKTDKFVDPQKNKTTGKSEQQKKIGRCAANFN